MKTRSNHVVSETQALNISIHYTLLIYTPVLFCFVLFFCFALFPIQGLCQLWFEIALTPPTHVSQNRACRSLGRSGNMAKFFPTVSLLPKAAETLKHQTQDQLDDNITSLMGQDRSQSYSHKELAKITSSLSHTLIATLKSSDKHAAQRQQELTSAQRCIEQLEREAQERQEGTDEVEQGAEEEINRLKVTLAATSHEMVQIKEDYADRADKLQYAEQLLEKAKADFRDKNSRIKALEA